jgi:hypothetical protein
MRIVSWIALAAAALSPAGAQTVAIVSPILAQFDGGPAAPAGTAFGSGESIFLSFDIAGFKPSDDEDPKIELSWDCVAVDAAGVPFVAGQKGLVKTELAPEDKKWRPRVRVEIALPQALPAGTGEIRINVLDRLSYKSASLVVPFRTRGLNLEGVTTLRALRFRFQRAEDSPQPLTVAAYRPGDTVWGRFEIAGYKLGKSNAFNVSYGLEVFRANGESLYKQEEAAREAGDSAYPRRYLFGVLSLQLTKDLAPGEYTIALRLRDHGGEQDAESKHIFRVE